MDMIRQLILPAYPTEFRGTAHPLPLAASLGTCRYWQIKTFDQQFCLRRWSRGTPPLERLQFMQALLWYVICEGIEFISLPIETVEHRGFADHDGSYWELLPWIAGMTPYESDFDETESTDWQSFCIISAMTTLAQFHKAAVTFPLPDFPLSTSVDVQRKLAQWERWINGQLAQLLQSLTAVQQRTKQAALQQLVKTGITFLDQIPFISRQVVAMLKQSARLGIPVQPIIGNASYRHLRFDDRGVCGIIDLTQLCVDSVALDIASLLGSMTSPDSPLWNLGLNTYQRERFISENEMMLVQAFYQSQFFLEGLNYLTAVFLEGKTFKDSQLAEINRRLQTDIQRTAVLKFV